MAVLCLIFTVLFSVEELKIASVSGSDMSCETDWLAMESCVPSGGSRMCGDLSGTSGERFLPRLINCNRLTSSRVFMVIKTASKDSVQQYPSKSLTFEQLHCRNYFD